MNMKRIKYVKLTVLLCVVTLLLTACLVIEDYPEPTDAFYVNDFADILDSEAQNHIQAVAKELEDVTTAQVVVVTMDGIGGDSLEEYTLELFRQWGIGQKDKDNGVLIFVDVEGRQSRIEVGYGLEGVLTDGKTGRIQDRYMIPHFRNGEYGQGIVAGFNVIVNEIYKEYGYTDRLIEDGNLAEGGILPEEEAEDEDDLTPFIIAIVIMAALLILDFSLFKGAITMAILRSSTRNRRGGFFGHHGGGGFGGGSFGGGGGSAGGGGSSRSW
jgi:uncharacterized protein